MKPRAWRDLRVDRVLPPLVPAVLAILLSGCGLLPGGTAAAVWSVAPGQVIDEQTTRLAVLVTRVGCNGGNTGEVQEPEVSLGDDEVVVTFSVTPNQRAATCPGNIAVGFDLVLPEALGDRRLVDGQCAADGEARTTSDCQPDGVRYHP